MLDDGAQQTKPPTARLLEALGKTGVAELLITLHRDRGLRVFNFHGTPLVDSQCFADKIRWIQSKYRVLTPEEAFSALAGEHSVPDIRSALLSFDDGLLSNLKVAAPVLEDKGLKGLFFVNPGFSLSSDPRTHYVENVSLADRAYSAEDYLPLSPDHIQDLSDRGHTIGNHTYSHCDLSKISQGEAAEEIGNAKELIEAWTSRSCESFAWTLAWNRISPENWRVALEFHRYCFSPCPGWNSWNDANPDLLFRSNLESGWTDEKFRLLATPLRDWVWSSRRRGLERYLRSITVPNATEPGER